MIPALPKKNGVRYRIKVTRACVCTRNEFNSKTLVWRNSTNYGYKIILLSLFCSVLLQLIKRDIPPKKHYATHKKQESRSFSGSPNRECYHDGEPLRRPKNPESRGTHT